MWCVQSSWKSSAPAGPILMMTISAPWDADNARARSVAFATLLPCRASASLLFRMSANRSALEPFSWKGPGSRNSADHKPPCARRRRNHPPESRSARRSWTPPADLLGAWGWMNRRFGQSVAVAELQAVIDSLGLKSETLQSRSQAKDRFCRAVRVGREVYRPTQARDRRSGPATRAEQLLPRGAHALFVVDAARYADHQITPA